MQTLSVALQQQDERRPNVSIGGQVVQPRAALVGAPSSFYIALQRRKDCALSASAA